jgi:hypothetical protein
MAHRTARARAEKIAEFRDLGTFAPIHLRFLRFLD